MSILCMYSAFQSIRFCHYTVWQSTNTLMHTLCSVVALLLLGLYMLILLVFTVYGLHAHTHTTCYYYILLVLSSTLYMSMELYYSML